VKHIPSKLKMKAKFHPALAELDPARGQSRPTPVFIKYAV